MMLEILLIILILFFIVILLIKRFVYFRPSYGLLPPLAGFEDIYEGNLHGWFLRGGEKTILFCNGNAGNLSHRQEKAIQLKNQGFSVLLFDYNGFGQSRGVPSEQLCFHSASTFTDLLLQSVKKENIIPYGESLGACVAMYIARKYNLPRVILESGLPGIKPLLQRKYSWGKFIGFLFNDFNTEIYMNGYQGKILVLHSKTDEIIPIHTVNYSHPNIKFEEISGTHNNPVISWETIKNFCS